MTQYIQTGECRVFSEYLFSPKTTQGPTRQPMRKPQYRMSLGWAKQKPDTSCPVYQYLLQLVMQALQEKGMSSWPMGASFPIIDGDADREAATKYPHQVGHWIIIPRSDNIVPILDANNNLIQAKVIGGVTTFKSGDFAIASINAYWYNNTSKGVIFGLEGVKKTRDGESIGGQGQRAPDQVFGAPTGAPVYAGAITPQAAAPPPAQPGMAPPPAPGGQPPMVWNGTAYVPASQAPAPMAPPPMMMAPSPPPGMMPPGAPPVAQQPPSPVWNGTAWVAAPAAAPSAPNPPPPPVPMAMALPPGPPPSMAPSPPPAMAAPGAQPPPPVWNGTAYVQAAPPAPVAPQAPPGWRLDPATNQWVQDTAPPPVAQQPPPPVWNGTAYVQAPPAGPAGPQASWPGAPGMPPMGAR